MERAPCMHAKSVSVLPKGFPSGIPTPSASAYVSPKLFKYFKTLCVACQCACLGFSRNCDKAVIVWAMSGCVAMPAYISKPMSSQYGTFAMSSFSSSVVGDCDFDRCKPGSIGKVTGLTFSRLNHPSIVCTYAPCNRDRVLFTQSRWILTPGSQRASPRPVILKGPRGVRKTCARSSHLREGHVLIRRLALPRPVQVAMCCLLHSPIHSPSSSLGRRSTATPALCIQ